jgi:hypothetical protein
MTHTNPSPVRDWGVSWIRTVVPVAWGAVVAFLLSRVPELHQALVNPAVTMAVTGAVVAAWYTLFRWLEPRLPAWLTAFVLGSNKTPTYVEGSVVSSTTTPTIPRQPEAR